ncbi:hypothetical protein BCIN_04g00880 [Botrytis cinerea B05.10]|uniref:Uncharacterized protein n=1 Tax=Botryotinia fuckeliana (strain B05.10) TaxID=332648 RepID=A0A384JEH6_BOTFB|nr:hypothetical protein BCIN_04g00880 [Botrytis cinerea B05.10]ATZ48870.1 hypothetical protein BCIN_04g00880 [Botrytis cinerea B05.10]
MLFLHWVCKTSLAKKRKKGKRKSVNQYWRDFKMLYHRVNDTFFDTNDSNEAILSIVINGTLEDNFGLDITAKAKPATGPDDLLLLFVQHWARDKSILPTKDDRHDIVTIMLFQSYTGGRPAEFVH